MNEILIEMKNIFETFIEDSTEFINKIEVEK